MEESGIGSHLAAIFLEEASRRLDVLEQAVQGLPTAALRVRRQRLQVIREAAHALKGSASTVGLEDAADAAGELERLARDALSGDPPSLGHLAELVAELRTLCTGLLPVGPVPPRPAPGPVRRQGSMARTVLCVEDDPASAALLVRLLGQRPWIAVVTAAGARQGFDLAKARLPDLVLLDLHLPDGSGEQVLTAFKDDPRTAEVPVVVMSADAIGPATERLRAAGAVGYLSKPLDLEELLATVDLYVGAVS